MVVQSAERAAAREERERRFRLLYLLKRSYTAAKVALDELVREHGLSASDFTMLSFLKGLEPCSAADLARAQRVTPQAVTQQIAQLRAKDLVSSETSEINRRISLISMTAAGRAALARVSAAARKLEDEMMADLSREESKTLTTLLARLIETADEKDQTSNGE